jgi:hypothetical protein
VYRCISISACVHKFNEEEGKLQNVGVKSFVSREVLLLLPNQRKLNDWWYVKR